MNQFLIILFLIGVFCGCASVPKKSTPLTSGMTLFEAMYLSGLNGFPTSYVLGVDEYYVKLGGVTWVVRNGYLSHPLGDLMYALKVDAIHSQNKNLKSVFIKLKPEQVNDLYSMSYADVIGRGLTLQDMNVVKNISQANIYLEFSFNVNEKEELASEVQMVPVSHYSSTTSNTTVDGKTVYGNSNTMTQSQTPIVRPTVRITYNRNLELKAFDVKTGQQIFVISVQGRGSSSDKRSLFAAMTAAAIRVIKKDPGQLLEFPVSVNDPVINFLKTGGKNDIFATEAIPWRGKTVDLCRAKASPEGFGHTPLTLAIKMQSSEIIQGLLVCGADPSLKNRSGIPPLIVAAEAGMKDVFAQLLSKGANPLVSVPTGAYSAASVGVQSVEVDIMTYLSPSRFTDFRNLLSEARKKRVPAASGAKQLQTPRK